MRSAEGIFACFDLRGEPTWLLAEELTELRPVGPLAGRALELAARPWPLPPGAAPRHTEQGWGVELEGLEAPGVGLAEGTTRWRVRWCDAGGRTLQQDSRAVEELEEPVVTAPRSAARWSLELEVDGVAVAGAQGAR